MLRPLIAVLALSPATALADAPTTLPVQGVLADDTGLALEDPVDVTFTLYADDAGTETVFAETRTIDPSNGHFVAYLGDAAPIDWAIARDHSALYLGIAVEDDAQMPLVPIATTPFAGWADFSGEAASLEGLDLIGVIDEAASSFGDDLHTRYSDAEAVAAMGSLSDTNPLHHARYSNAMARLAMGALDASNPLNHERFTANEAVDAMGTVDDDNPLNHARYSDDEVMEVVESSDSLLRNTTDTLDGDLTVTGTVRDDDSPEPVHFIKMRVEYNGLGEFVYTDATGTTREYQFGALPTSHMATGAGQVFDGAGLQTTTSVFFNIEASPSKDCTLLGEGPSVTGFHRTVSSSSAFGGDAAFEVGWTEFGFPANPSPPGDPFATRRFYIMCF